MLRISNAVSVLHDKTLFRHHYQDHPLAKYHDMGILTANIALLLHLGGWIKSLLSHYSLEQQFK
jgi:hypothetical protein